MQTLQNLSTEGLPITLTEFGVKPPGASGAGAASISLNSATQQSAASILSDTMRLVFGNPNGSLTSVLFGRSTQTLANALGTGGASGGFNPLYQVGGPRSVQLALKLQF